MATVKIDAEKLTALAEKIPKVYEAGKKGDSYEAGQMAERDMFWDIFLQNGTRRSFVRAFASGGFTIDNFYPNHDIIFGGECAYAFYNMSFGVKFSLSKRLQECGVKLDTSGANYLQMLFAYAQDLTEIPTIDLSGLTNRAAASRAEELFRGCLALKTIEKIIIEEDIIIRNWFLNCVELKNVTFEGVIGQGGLDLRYSKKLSKASIISVMNALSTTAEGKTVTLSLTAINNAFETSEGAADGSESEEWLTLAATRANWTISLIDG